MERLPARRALRLPDYDYSTSGAYFVTLCTVGKQKLLSHIVGRGALTPPQVQLTSFGHVVEKHILRTNEVYPSVTIDAYVIMPNHVHLIVSIHAQSGGVRAPRPTDLPLVIRSIKSMTTREIGRSVWQTSYYDHIIRNEADALRIRQYIDQNPARWAEDEYYSE